MGVLEIATICAIIFGAKIQSEARIQILQPFSDFGEDWHYGLQIAAATDIPNSSDLPCFPIEESNSGGSNFTSAAHGT